MRIFEVELNVKGAVTVRNNISFNTDKELNYGEIFNSNIIIRKHSAGFIISSTVRTKDKDRAYKVALIFVSKMLDVLSLRINSGLAVGEFLTMGLNNKDNVKTMVTKEEFDLCFEYARDLNLNENKLLRAMSWYKKGLYTVDPFDKFLALWNSICVIADGYCEDNERTRFGIINKIWNCFQTLWGNPVNWEYINENWINENNEIRNMIAHGGVTVDIEYIDKVIDRLDALEKVAYRFITQWSKRLNYNILD